MYIDLPSVFHIMATLATRKCTIIMGEVYFARAGFDANFLFTGTIKFM